MENKEIFDLFLKLVDPNRAPDFIPPDYLYHYTSANGIKAILSKSGMFASPIFSTNDPTEIIYGWELVREVVNDLLETKKYPEIAVGLSNLTNGDPFKIIDQFPKINLISFSSDDDNLSQWRSYADNGNGFALEINTRNLMNEPTRWTFRKCIYDRNVQKEKVMHLIDICTQVKETLTEEDFSGKIVPNFVIFLWELLTVFKHKSYRDENEWRCIFFQNDSLEYEEAYVSNSHLKVSSLIKPQKKAVTKIIIGPKNNRRTAELALKALIRNCGFAEKEGIKITLSEAPYR